MLDKKLKERQSLYFDGILYSFKMIESSYQGLINVLSLISENSLNKKELSQDFDIDSWALVYIWSIIDSTHRLRLLLAEAPGVDRKLKFISDFFSQTKNIKDFRDFMQHMNREIGGLIDQKKPLWGSISWIFTKENQYNIFLLHVGSFPGDRSINFPVPTGTKTVSIPIDSINLNLSSHNIEISEIIKSLKIIEDLIKKIDKNPLGYPRGVLFSAKLGLEAKEDSLLTNTPIKDNIPSIGQKPVDPV